MLIMFLKVIAGIFIVPFISVFLDAVEECMLGIKNKKKEIFLLQPAYDFLKLLSKQMLSTNKIQYVFVVSTLFFSLCASVLLFLTQNILAVFLSILFADLMLILGATSVNSPFSRMAAQRSIIRIFSYMPILLLVCINIYLINDSLLLEDFINKNMITQIPLCGLAVIIVMLIKLSFLKFDFLLGEKREKELSCGLYLEFSGPQLAILKLSKFYERIVWLGVIALFIGSPLWLGIIISLVIYIVVVILDMIVPRYSWKQASNYSWFIGFGLAFISTLWFFIYK